LSFSGSLVGAVVAHVWEEERFHNILKVVAGVSELLWQFGELDLELTLVQSGSLLFSNLDANWRDGESLLLVLLAFLCLAGLGLGVFGHLLVALELSLNLDLMWHSLAGFAELEFSLDVDGQVLLQQFLAEDKELFALDVLWAFVFSFELEATVWLSLSVGSVTDSLGEGLERLGGSWQGSSSLVGGITRSTTDVQAAAGLRELENVLDGGRVLVVQDLLHGFEFLW